jgi:hypothetical protein
LEFAVTNLPITASEEGRAYKPAAEALLARVQLTIGNWAEAEELSANVINNYAFELVTPYAALWDINNQENSEIIWAVQFTDDPLFNGPGNSGHLYFIFDYTFNPAMVRDIENGRPFQRFLPTNFLFKLYDRSMDARWNGSFKTVWYANIPGEINGHTVNPGDTAIHIVMEPVPDKVKQAVPYWIIDFILDERARELVGEKHRWYDLKRTGTLLERVRKHNLDAAPNIMEMHLVRPIPQTQIDRVGNQGEFQQNPGY